MAELLDRRERAAQLDAEAPQFRKRIWVAISIILALPLLDAILKVFFDSIADFHPTEYPLATSMGGVVALVLLLAPLMRNNSGRKMTYFSGRTTGLATGGGWLTVFQWSAALVLVLHWFGFLMGAKSRDWTWSTQSGALLFFIVIETIGVFYGFVLIAQRRPLAKVVWIGLLSIFVVLGTANILSHAPLSVGRDAARHSVVMAIFWLIYWHRSYRVRVTFATI